MPDLHVLWWIGGFLGALILLGLAVGALVQIAKVVVRISAPHFVEAVEKALKPELDTINRELHFNGGGSIKDVVGEIASTLKELRDSNAKEWEYQHKRNHGMINKQAAVSGLVQLMHKDELEEYGSDILMRLERLAEMERQEKESGT